MDGEAPGPFAVINRQGQPRVQLLVQEPRPFDVPDEQILRVVRLGFLGKSFEGDFRADAGDVSH